MTNARMGVWLNPSAHAETSPEKAAHIMVPSGQMVTYREIEERSCRLAQFMYAAGLRRGDHIAIFMENHPRWFEVYWAAMRSGLYFTPVNRFLAAEEAAFIVDDCEAKVLVTSAALADVATGMLDLIPSCTTRLMVDGVAPGYASYEEAIAAFPAQPLDEQPRGEVMFYSSGTTGRPKGIWRPLGKRSYEEPTLATRFFAEAGGYSEDTVYLSPAPLYHGSPTIFCATTQAIGGTAVVLERFDPLEALRAIEKHGVTHSQWVPTMFARMLRLPPEDRARFDLSSHKDAVVGAAPCPAHVKEQMIEWWGPIITEYFGASEFNGQTKITSEEWLAHRGSVGRAERGTIHICDEEGKELPPGAPGLIYFENPQTTFQYYRDEDKTKTTQHREHPTWSAVGDMGYLDAEGYLYLTDRKDFMIISGGVNIYPAEIEGALSAHPAVCDVAVIGVPNEEFGEEVKAVVQLEEGVESSADLERELIDFCRDGIAHYKCPRSVDFVSELPRLPTGKLYKFKVREPYWAGHESRIL